MNTDHIKRIEVLEAFAKKCIAQFRYYEKSHRDKNTEDSLKKAEVNRQIAEEGEDLFKMSPKEAAAYARGWKEAYDKVVGSNADMCPSPSAAYQFMVNQVKNGLELSQIVLAKANQ